MSKLLMGAVNVEGVVRRLSITHILAAS